ncbi:hypothetical protein C0Q70_12685 [Pomacea canaliculata]|uniref:Ig-like domain-containing protein n=1 Tax=Pomacea canaliculata TaxID=400727 RepID=A0A2T7P2A8_POMCA|nr:hypothetical protein C0Q70_12685 [Pomacea canaliculata]
MGGSSRFSGPASPGDLSIFCPRVVLLGSSFVVACETETAGSPSAIVRLEGEKDRQKVIRSVPRSANGTQFRCHVTWGGDTNSTSYYTLLVACKGLWIDICVLPHRHLLTPVYKPSIDGPDIVSIRSSSPSNSANTSLVCSASEAYPAVIYSWQGACAEVTTSVDGSTCLVSRPISDTDVITCTAVNSLFDISVTTSYSPGLTGGCNVRQHHYGQRRAASLHGPRDERSSRQNEDMSSSRVSPDLLTVDYRQVPGCEQNGDDGSYNHSDSTSDDRSDDS